MPDRKLLDKIFCAALAAVDPLSALPPHLLKVKEAYLTGRFDRLIVAGFGKAAIPMALAAEEVLGFTIDSGLVIVPHGTKAAALPDRIRVATAGHPHPDWDGVAATLRIMELVRGGNEKTLLLLLVSGGGSALFTAPAEHITLEDKLETSRLLMEAGADIVALNTVRKHLSKIKGGKLADLAHPARIITLAISDVPGDRPDLIGSGPACPDPTTFSDAVAVLERFNLTDKVPASVRERLRQGVAGAVHETPKPGDAIFSSVTTIIAARNHDAVEAAARAAHHKGLQVHVLEEQLLGEARQVGRKLAELAISERERLAPGERICLIGGGETTVRVVGKGKGGRNQEMALAFAMAIEGMAGITFMSAGTDGVDGPTDAAGAIVDGSTAAKAKAAGFDPGRSLEENDAYPLLDACAALLKTGPTGTNVMDLQIAILSR